VRQRVTDPLVGNLARLGHLTHHVATQRR
jgi:hypothetical protein